MAGIIFRGLLDQSAPGGGGIGASLWDDDFAVGSAIDTTGTRFASAVPWTTQNAGSATYTVSGGQLSIATLGSGTSMNPRIATESLSGAGSTWRFRCGCASLSTNAGFNGLGIILRESATGKQLCYGLVRDSSLEQLQIRRMTSYTSWVSNYGLVVTSSPFYTGELEVECDGTNLIFRRYESGTWFTRKTVAQTVDFTTGPDEIGLWMNGTTNTGTTTTAVFDYWQRVA